MPKKREILNLLGRTELQSFAERYELEVADRRVKGNLVDALASSKKARLNGMLETLPRATLKDICRSLDFDDSGREKLVLVERILAGDKPRGPGKKEATKARGRTRKEPSANGATLGFEATLWTAADKLRNNLDAAEYKHVVLGLIFLKYIADAFTEKHAELKSQVAQGADPEDRDEYLAENIFWVPKKARWSYLQANAKQPTIGKIVDDAMLANRAGEPVAQGRASQAIRSAISRQAAPGRTHRPHWEP